MARSAETSMRPAVEGLVSSLDHIAHGTEDAFLELGGSLQRIHAEAAALHARIRASVEVLGGSGEGGVLHGIESHVRESRAATSGALIVVGGLEDQLAAIVSLLKGVSSLGEELRHAGAFLRALGINTSIECSRAARIGAMFAVVARDSVTLAERIGSLTDQILDQADEARTVQEKTLACAAADRKALRDVSRQADETAAQAVERLNGLFARMESVIQEAVLLSHTIAGDIGKVVMGVQFHDNLRQRVEHIMEALTDIQPRLEAAKSPRPDCETFLVMDLQRSQLEVLCREVTEVRETQTRAVHTIADNITRLAGIMGGITGGESLVGRDALSGLTAAMARLASAQASSEKLCEGITRSAAGALQATGRLDAFVRETVALASQVHLNALNSIIKAAKLGRIGKPLQVLSQSMAAVSKQVKALAPLFLERMERIRQSAQAGEEAAHGAGGTGQAGRVFDEQRLQDAFQRFREEAAAIVADGGRLGEAVLVQHEKLSFFQELETALEEQSGFLARLAGRIRPPEEELAKARHHDLSRNVAERYTMDQERAVHQQLFVPGPQEAAAATAGPPGEGVILFDDAEAPSAPAIPEESVVLFDEDTPAGDVVLFEEEQPPAAAPASPAAETEKKEFGENVELF